MTIARSQDEDGTNDDDDDDEQDDDDALVIFMIATSLLGTGFCPSLCWKVALPLRVVGRPFSQMMVFFSREIVRFMFDADAFVTAFWA